MRFPMSPKLTSYVVPMPPKGWLARKRSVQNLNNKAEITPKRYEIECQLLLITNTKSHTGFRLVPSWMTLNDLERRNSPYFAFFNRIRQIFRPIISQWLKIDL